MTIGQYFSIKNIFVPLSFYILCISILILLQLVQIGQANETRAHIASMMDYQTQRRFGKRAKIHANDDTNGSVHSKNKISVFFLNIPKLSFRLKYKKKIQLIYTCWPICFTCIKTTVSCLQKKKKELRSYVQCTCIVKTDFSSVINQAKNKDYNAIDKITLNRKLTRNCTYIL